MLTVDAAIGIKKEIKKNLADLSSKVEKLIANGDLPANGSK